MIKKIILILLAVLLLLTGCAAPKTEIPDSTQSVSDNVFQLQQNPTNTTEQSDTAATEESSAATENEEPESIDPKSVWIPICEEYITLRAEPDGDEITKIPAGAEVILKKWEGKHALVIYKKQTGYVLSNYIKPADETQLTEGLQVVNPVSKYSYEQMQADIAALAELYPDLVRTDIIGYTECGREIPVMQIGNPNAEYHILLQGAIHGREHFTACLLMILADYGLSQNHFVQTNFCYHIIPMSNPDGVIISQTKELMGIQELIYSYDLEAGYTSYGPATYAEQWKANAIGIDLNRNFFSGWLDSLEHLDVSSQNYRGDIAFSAAETVALRDYTLLGDFDATLSFHSHGSVIYYQYGYRQPVNNLSYSLALTAEQVTGYQLMTYDGTSGAGYKDWAMDELGIPSLTLEIGCATTPLETRDIYNTVMRCRELLPAIHAWVIENC